MKTRRSAMAVLAVLVTFGVAHGQAKKDKLDGTWTMESGERNGQPPPDEFQKSFRLTIMGDKIKIGAEGREREGAIRIDASRKPKEIDITVGERMTKGIYELEGDTLKICHARPGGDRPAEFSAKEGTNNMLMVLKREKKEGADKPGVKPLSMDALINQRPGESLEAYFKRMDRQKQEWKANWKRLMADLKSKPDEAEKHRGLIVALDGKPIGKDGKLWGIRAADGFDCEVLQRPSGIKIGGALPKELDDPAPEKPTKPVARKPVETKKPNISPKPDAVKFDPTIYVSSSAYGIVDKIDVKAKVITIKDAAMVSTLAP